MKPFQQLLLALAGTGLLAPLAANAQDATAISSSAAISSYMEQQDVDRFRAWESQNQVTSVSQFSDVRPTDWAYQALSNLVERYGCVAGYPDGTFKGRQSMTRYEAAALLNACLDRVTEVTDELKRLMAEFEKELAVLKGRVDTLEGKVKTLKAQQFSTTTKLRGEASFIIGGTPDFNSPLRLSDGSRPARPDQTTFNYDSRLSFDTSFTGKDLLRTRLRAGNFAQSPFGQPVVGLNATEAGFEENCGLGVDCGDVVAINRLFYQFPLGSNFTATIGGRVRQDDMLAVWPSAYPADTVLDIFTYAGAPGTYSLNLGAGGGLWWKSGGFSISANYVSANGDVGNPIAGTANCGGIGNACSSQTGTGQIAYTGSNWGIAAAYTYSSGGAGLYTGNGTPLATIFQTNAAATNSSAPTAKGRHGASRENASTSPAPGSENH